MTATNYYRPVWWQCSRCGEKRLQSQKPEYPHDCPRNATSADPFWKPVGDVGTGGAAGRWPW